MMMRSISNVVLTQYKKNSTMIISKATVVCAIYWWCGMLWDALGIIVRIIVRSIVNASAQEKLNTVNV